MMARMTMIFRIAPRFGTHLPMLKVTELRATAIQMSTMPIVICMSSDRSGMNIRLNIPANRMKTAGTHTAVFTQYAQVARDAQRRPKALRTQA